MIFSRYQFLAVAVMASGLQGAHAAGVKDCDGALVKATYNRTDKQFVDWRLAEQVDESSYNSAKAEAAGNAVIYGVPMGANYGQFKESIQTLKRSNSQSFTSDTFRNVAWTGLDPNAVTTYSDCLKALSKKNLVFIPRFATTSDISFDLDYTVIGRSPNPLPVKWTGIEKKNNVLPARLDAGTTPIIIKRPAKDSNLAVSGSGLSDTIIVTPMPKPLTDADLYVNRCEIVRTPTPLPQLTPGNSTTWACLPLQKGDYQVSVNMTPSVAPAKAVRVNYTLKLITGSGDKSKTVDLGGNTMDINASAGLPNVFQVSGVPAPIAAGEPVRIQLTINGVADHCCFHTSNHRDGTILVPESVQITLNRVGA
ncbi:hypothetical protein LJR220_007094 [Bradyrhizobium sp. LjRoot220]|uniref:hypothetical protein n=1 Tax=Bradyrhizobium sp. LjRoot220 TaxID=3342284 RepID=UPI003ED04ABA